jgi:hypothetical protein
MLLGFSHISIEAQKMVQPRPFAKHSMQKNNKAAFPMKLRAVGTGAEARGAGQRVVFLAPAPPWRKIRR